MAGADGYEQLPQYAVADAPVDQPPQIERVHRFRRLTYSWLGVCLIAMAVAGLAIMQRRADPTPRTRSTFDEICVWAVFAGMLVTWVALVVTLVFLVRWQLACRRQQQTPSA